MIHTSPCDVRGSARIEFALLFGCSGVRFIRDTGSWMALTGGGPEVNDKAEQHDCESREVQPEWRVMLSVH